MNEIKENAVNQLPAETVKLITSTQIVTSVCTAVKELLENAIDASGSIIQIRLENYGLDLIEVKDNGWGVSYDNVQKMFLPGYTSKIKQFEDLDRLHSYGFRGEALAAICKIAKVSLTTKTNSDALAMTYEIDSAGVPVSSKPSHLTVGTILTVTNLFSNLPVRRLYLSAKKKMTEELKKTEHVVQSLSVIHPELNVTLIHNKCVVWKKNSVKGLKQSFMQAVTLKTVSKMDQIGKSLNQVNLDLIVPKKNLNTVDDVLTNSPNSIYLYVNKRPVTCKNLSQPVQEHILHHYNKLNTSFKHAICLISVEVPPQLVDINMEPNKTKVLLKNQQDLIKMLDDLVGRYYGNENFQCSALRDAKPEEEEEEIQADRAEESIIEDGEELEKENNERQYKKLKLDEKKNQDIEKFIEKNRKWNVEIVHDETPEGPQNEVATSNETVDDGSPSLCSQINKENCVLTTPDEVSELNAILNEKHHSVISTNNKTSVTRLVDRDELQCRAAAEKKILPDWPMRSITVTSSVDTPVINSVTDTSSILIENKEKVFEETGAEIERNAGEWSKNLTFDSNATTSCDHDGETANFNLSMESVSSQMGKKEMKAFTKFARIMRPKIIAEFPNMVFTQVASLLAQRWKALTPAEVKYYEQMAHVVDIKRKIHEEEKQSIPSGSENLKTKTKGSTDQNLISLLERVKKKSRLNRPPRKEITMVTSLNRIKTSLENSKGRNSDKTTDVYRIVGKLQNGRFWLYVKGNEIGHVRENCLQEVVTYRKLLSSHSIERKPLDKPIIIDEVNLGSVLWTVLISLDVEPCLGSSRFVVTSDVVDKNGFRIEMEKNNDLYTLGYITEVAASIPQFGVSDLKKALQLYLNHGEIEGLASWRPISVQNYLTNEAVRLHQKPANFEESEMSELMDTYNLCLRHFPPVCLHNKSIFNVLHYIQD